MGTSSEKQFRPARILSASLQYALLLCLLSGCFSSREDVSSRSPRQWTKEECLTAVIASTASNLTDYRTNIKLMAIPYFPSVVEAIVRLQEIDDTVGTFDSTYRYQLDALLKSGSGLYYDWEAGKYYSPKGRYYRERTDIDSLLFLVSLLNTGWPCVPPWVPMGDKMVPLFASGQMPCYTPDLDSLERRIVLRNEKGETVRPRFVWGRKNANLTDDEDLFVLFDLRSPEGKHFFREGKYVYFELTLSETFISKPVSLEYAD
jgi:hypothetical protein